MPQSWVSGSLFTSAQLRAELADILGRRKFAKKLAASSLSVEQHSKRYAALATAPIVIVGVAPDPDDDVIIGTALAAQADAIVTGDRTLLSVTEYRHITLTTAAMGSICSYGTG